MMLVQLCDTKFVVARRPMTVTCHVCTKGRKINCLVLRTLRSEENLRTLREVPPLGHLSRGQMAALDGQAEVPSDVVVRRHKTVTVFEDVYNAHKVCTAAHVQPGVGARTKVPSNRGFT